MICIELYIFIPFWCSRSDFKKLAALKRHTESSLSHGESLENWWKLFFNLSESVQSRYNVKGIIAQWAFHSRGLCVCVCVCVCGVCVCVCVCSFVCVVVFINLLWSTFSIGSKAEMKRDQRAREQWSVISGLESNEAWSAGSRAMKRDQRGREPQVSNDEQSVNEIKTQVLLKWWTEC